VYLLLFKAFVLESHQFLGHTKLPQHQLSLLIVAQEAHKRFIDPRERCKGRIEANCCSTNYDVIDDLQCFSMNDSTESMRRRTQDFITTSNVLITETSQDFCLWSFWQLADVQRQQEIVTDSCE
jgi:hypothetical protein